MNIEPTTLAVIIVTAFFVGIGFAVVIFYLFNNTTEDEIEADAHRIDWLISNGESLNCVGGKWWCGQWYGNDARALIDKRMSWNK